MRSFASVIGPLGVGRWAARRLLVLFSCLVIANGPPRMKGLHLCQELDTYWLLIQPVYWVSTDVILRDRRYVMHLRFLQIASGQGTCKS